jgi:hypothetical protein
MMTFYNSLTILPLLLVSVYASSFQMKELSTSNHAIESRYGQEVGQLSSFDRSLFEMPSTFDFYNSLCRTRCDDGEKLLSFLNACSTSDDDSNCGGLEYVTTDSSRFVDCDCYDPSNSNAFKCPTYELLSIPPDDHSFEICIVAVSSFDFGRGAASQAVDFSKPLPEVLGLTHTFDSVHEDFEPRMTSFKSYFDTTCSVKSDDSQFPLPIFPGYGKFPNTCQDFGFIDLEDGSPLLPEAIAHFNGQPPTESFWYQFMDGTSAAFWPSLPLLNAPAPSAVVVPIP